MVWIHGGTFLVGSGQDANGGVLAARGKVMVVTINYRLGPLGFLALKALDSESPDHISGNYGLLDQQAALRWVRRNILAFGGDPNNITIFGESAGGISVCLQLVSPKAAGLFQRAINQSGPCQNEFKLAEGKLLGAKLAAKLGCDSSADIPACMRAKPTNAVLTALPANPIGGGVLWFPVVDGVVLPTTAEEAFKSGKFNQVPVINGSNHDEGTLFVTLGFARQGKTMTAAQYPLIINSGFGKNAPRVLQEYPLNSYSSPTSTYSAVFTDSFFSCPIRKTTRLLSAYVPTYAYEFNDTNAPNSPFFDHLSLGAYHSSDIQYVFQSPFPSGPKPGDLRLSAKQIALSNQMISYWTTFAATGRPDGTSPRWSRYQSDDSRILSFVPLATGYETGFAKDHRCALWDPLGSP